MQGDWQTFEDARPSRTTIPLAQFVRPSPLKGGLKSWLPLVRKLARTP